VVFGFFRRRRRDRLRAEPFPPEWRAYVDRNIPLFARLSAAEQTEVLGHAQVLLAEKHFEGCDGLEMTDEIRVTIAVQAARLLLHRDDDYFPMVRTVLVYPAAVAHERREHLGGGIVEESEMAAAGLATGHLRAIVLAWDSVTHGLTDPRDARDVILHEFAHELDYQDHSFDGTPLLSSRAAYGAWARTMQAEFEALQAAVAKGRRTVIDEYGATNPAEFFAVLTEHFFERPDKLRQRHPALYDLLREFYRQDPASAAAPPPPPRAP
jgi:Mlc titration factor MtfA (ptsG expression regulator)